MTSPTDRTMEDEITRLRNEVASLKRQLAASDVPQDAYSNWATDPNPDAFLTVDDLDNFNDDSSLALPAASAPAAKNQKKIKGSDNSSPGNDDFSLALPAASDDSSLALPAASAPADQNLASVVAKVVISDGKMSSVNPTTAGTSLLQYCLKSMNRFKSFSSSSSNSKSKVFMCVCLSALSPAEYFSITGEMIMQDCCVTCVGFESMSLDLVGACLTPTATHCIVGLPTVIHAHQLSAEVENILVYPHHYRSGEVKAVSSKQFWRMATPNTWIPGEILDWYGSFLSVNQHQPDVKVFTTDFFSLAIRPDKDKQLGRKLDIASCTARNCFPCYFEKHWTLATYEAPTVRAGRLCFMDSLELFDQKITQTFEDLFGFSEGRVSLCHMNGGLQFEQPPTECGIFTMQNMEAFMKAEPFFKIQGWESAARQRTSDGCEVRRNQYATLLREHSVQYLRLGTPVSLGPGNVLTEGKQSPHEVVLISDDSADSGRKRKSKLKKQGKQSKKHQHSVEQEVPQPQQKREEYGKKTKTPPSPAASHHHSTRTKSTVTVQYCTTCRTRLGSGSCQACWDSLDPRKQRSDLFRHVDAVLQAREMINRFSAFLNYAQVCYDEVIAKPQSLNKYKGFR